MGSVTNISLTTPYSDGLVCGEAFNFSLKTNISTGTVYYYQVTASLLYPWSSGSSAAVMKSDIISKTIKAGTNYTLTGTINTVSPYFKLENHIRNYLNNGCDPYAPQNIKLEVWFFNSKKEEYDEYSTSSNNYDYSKFYLSLKPPEMTVTAADASTGAEKHSEKYGAWIAGCTPTDISVTEVLQSGITYTKKLTVNDIEISIGEDGLYHLVPFTNAGVFIPVYTMCDIRGNEYKEYCAPITVLGYTPPTVTLYNAERCAEDVDHLWRSDDDGGFIWHTLKASVQEYPQGNDYSIRIWVQPRDGEMTSYLIASGTGINDGAINMIDNFGADDVFKGIEIVKNRSHYVAVEIIDWFGNSSGKIESAQAVTAVGALFDIEEHGVAVGMTVGGELPDDATEKVFECAYSAYFHGGIKQGLFDTVLLKPEAGFASPGVYGHQLRLIRIGSIVFLTGTIQRTKASSTIVCVLPAGWAPPNKHEYILGVGTGSNIARLCVHFPADSAAYPNGYINIEWYHACSTTSNSTATFTWLSVNGMWSLEE